MSARQRAKKQTVTSPARVTLRDLLWPWLIAALTLGADQLTKLLVVRTFTPGESLPLIPHVVHLTYIHNTGAAFGMLKGQQALFIGLSLVVVGWIARELLTKPSMARTAAWACGLVAGGAVGNLIDRVRLGYVIDFIDLRVWPVFNVGDSAITIGVALLLWHSVRCTRSSSNSVR